MPASPRDSASSNDHDEQSARLPLLDFADMTDEQRRLATELIEGPRKGVVGPFVPLLYAPHLFQVVEPLGSELRFRGELDRRVHELVVCLVAATTKNQFEWDIHSRSARELGVSERQLESLRHGSAPPDLASHEHAALAYCAQHANLNLAAFVAAAFGGLLASAQRQLSTPARHLRRRVARIEGVEVLTDGTRRALTRESLLTPLESALKLLCWASVAVAGALALSRYNVL